MSKYLVMLCNPLEAHPKDAQLLNIDSDEIEQFLSIIEKNNKALIIYPNFEEAFKNEN